MEMSVSRSVACYSFGDLVGCISFVAAKLVLAKVQSLVDGFCRPTD